MVLVQGTARVDEEDLRANRERYVREANAKLLGHRACATRRSSSMAT